MGHHGAFLANTQLTGLTEILQYFFGVAGFLAELRSAQYLLNICFLKLVERGHAMTFRTLQSQMGILTLDADEILTAETVRNSRGFLIAAATQHLVCLVLVRDQVSETVQVEGGGKRVNIASLWQVDFRPTFRTRDRFRV